MFAQMIEGDDGASGDALLGELARGANIDEKRGLGRARRLGGEGGAEAFGVEGQIGAGFEAVQSIFKKTGDVIEADSAEAQLGFALAAGGGDDDDRVTAIEDGADPGGVLAAET